MNGRLVLALSAALVSTLACSRDQEAAPVRQTKNMGGAPRPVAVAQPAPAADEGEEAPAVAPTAEHVFIESTDAAPVTYTYTQRSDAGQAKEDPDQAVVESGRRAASACFTGISDGTTSRTATIRVLVLPTGAVSRAEVSAPTTSESWILSCLEGVGSGLRFSEKPKADLRNFSINVFVSRGH